MPGCAACPGVGFAALLSGVGFVALLPGVGFAALLDMPGDDMRFSNTISVV
jgi:hypothetical protein